MPLSQLWQSSGSMSADGSADEPSSEDKSDQVKRFLKRQRQTAKARAASLRSRAIKHLAKSAALQPPQHPADKFKDDLQQDSEINQPGSHQTSCRVRRLRLLVSYLVAWCAAILKFVLDISNKVEHTLVVGIVDDMNCRLASIPSDAPQWRQSRVVAVMNCVQRFMVCWKASETPDTSQETYHHRLSFSVCAPMTVLPKSDRDTIGSELKSRILTFLGQTSSRYRHLNLPSALIQNARIQAVMLVFDSLKTNIAIMKQFRQSVFMYHKQQRQERRDSENKTLHPLLGVFCFLHQLNLSRQPILCGISGFWASVVRLSHLFENQNFRGQFRSALLHVLCDSFVVIPVTSLPGSTSEWRRERASLYRTGSVTKNGCTFTRCFPRGTMATRPKRPSLIFALGNAARARVWKSEKITQFYTSSKVLFADFFDWVPSALVLQMEALRPSFAVPQGDRLLTLGPWVVYKNLWFKLDALGLQVWQNISQWNVTCFYFIP